MAIRNDSAAVNQTTRRPSSNRSRVLNHLRNHGPVTRAELAQHCGMSRPTAGVIADKLLAEGVLIEIGKGTGSLGRKGRLLSLATDGATFVVAAMDGRHLRWARLPLAEPSGLDNDIWQDELPCPDSLESLAQLLPCHDMRAVALSISGIVDEQQGRVLFSHRLPWLQTQPLLDWAKTALGCPLMLVQEIRALALGQLAQEPKLESFLLVDCGVGLGAAAVVNGQLIDQVGPFVGEIGHSPVPGNERICGCGGTGCLETLVADGRILSCSDEDLQAAASGIGSACNTIGLEHIVLTGDFTRLGEARQQRLCAGIRASCLAGRMGRLHIRFAPRHRCRGLHRLLSSTYIDPETPP